MRVVMTMAIAGLIAGGLTGSATAGQDYVDRLLKLEKLERDEARGGPYIRGGRSPFMQRYKVCNVMPTPVRDPKTGQKTRVMKEVCWWE